MKMINHYIDTVFTQEDSILEEVLTSIRDKGMKSISVSPSTGKFLSMLVAVSQAKRVLEIGALGGYSGICLARGFGKDGQLVSLEKEESYARLAHDNLAKAGHSKQVTYMTGPALENLEQLVKDQERFDFFFIDADKENYENYLNYCIELAEDEALIVCDNVLANGSVANEQVEAKRYTELMKTFNETVANHPQLESTLIPIGDGLTISKVRKRKQ